MIRCIGCKIDLDFDDDGDLDWRKGGYCRECDDFLCGRCIQVHGRLPVTRGHVIVERDGDEDGRLKSGRTEEMLKKATEGKAAQEARLASLSKALASYETFESDVKRHRQTLLKHVDDEVAELLKNVSTKRERVARSLENAGQRVQQLQQLATKIQEKRDSQEFKDDLDLYDLLEEGAELQLEQLERQLAALLGETSIDHELPVSVRFVAGNLTGISVGRCSLLGDSRTSALVSSAVGTTRGLFHQAFACRLCQSSDWANIVSDVITASQIHDVIKRFVGWSFGTADSSSGGTKQIQLRDNSYARVTSGSDILAMIRDSGSDECAVLVLTGTVTSSRSVVKRDWRHLVRKVIADLNGT